MTLGVIDQFTAYHTVSTHIVLGLGLVLVITGGWFITWFITSAGTITGTRGSFSAVLGSI